MDRHTHQIEMENDRVLSIERDGSGLHVYEFGRAGEEGTRGGFELAFRGPMVDAMAAEILRFANRDHEHEKLAAELVGALGLDRETLDREGLPVGDSILETVRALRAEVDGHRQEAAEGEEERARLVDRVRELEGLRADHSIAGGKGLRSGASVQEPESEEPVPPAVAERAARERGEL